MSNRDQASCIFETTAAEKVPQKRKDLGFVKVVRRCPPVQACCHTGVRSRLASAHTH